ncbi:hypothetical protein [Dyadobacter sp. CY351]|nr:hypothetical protein [Dyadobacter sp. CY351]
MALTSDKKVLPQARINPDPKYEMCLTALTSNRKSATTGQDKS